MSNNNETILNGRYKLTAQQGSGGMAVIYRAVDLSLGRTVAIKILRPSLITNDTTFLNRFRDEARAIANLSHPNIVTVHDVGNDGQTHYIVMEFIEGQDLKKIIRTEGVLTVKRTLELAIQICDGIGFAHRAGLVHADVKPQNILVTNDDRVKVTDFGIAQALTDTQPMQRQEVVWGSPHYFSPEQARGEKPTPASDVYSIGIVMFEMLTGRLPYTGASQQDLALAHLREPVPLVTDFNPGVPDNLARIVQKVMSKEPAMRFSMADQLGNILKSYRDRSQQYTSVNVSPGNLPATGGQQSASIPPPPPPPPGPLPLPQSGQQSPRAPQPSSSVPPSRSDQSVQRPSGVPAAPSRIPPQAVPPQASQSNAAATQRYGPPAAPQPARPAVPAPGQQSRGFQEIGPAVRSDQTDSRRLSQSQQYMPRDYAPDYRTSAPAGLDIVTVGLAVLAFLAIACLIPLYVLVLQAYSG